MKRQILMVAALGCLWLPGTMAAHAQSAVIVKIPFPFVVGDHTFPDGEYRVSSIQDKVLVQNSEGKTVAVALSNAASGRSTGVSGQVVFHCYERLCFLSELWIPSQDGGRRLMKSLWETGIGKAKAPVMFALVGMRKN